MESRAKKEGKRKAQRRKEKRQEEGANKLLIKLLKENTEEKALYDIGDLEENPKVRPKMDLPYYNILIERGIFSDECQDHLNKFFRGKSGGKTKKTNTNTTSSDTQSSNTHYIPIDTNNSDSSEEEDPFDFYEVIYADENSD